MPARVRRQVERVTDHLDRRDPGGVLAVYLYGSAVLGGLRPDSDIDLFLVTQRSLTGDEREALVGLLLQFSGCRATVVPGRPVELTSVVRDDVVPWHYPPTCDFQYGEWLRDELVADPRPGRRVDPTSRSRSRPSASGARSSGESLRPRCWTRCRQRISVDLCRTPSQRSWPTWTATSGTSC